MGAIVRGITLGSMAMLVFCSAAVSSAHAKIENLEASYRFLVSDQETHGGALYTATAGKLKGRPLPLSFYDSAEYWGVYVCGQPDRSCAVTDRYNPTDYTLNPETGLAGDLQTERVNVHNGTNIYDAAVWQIAVVLGQVTHSFANPFEKDAYDLAKHQNLMLKESHGGNAATAVPSANRALTKEHLFLYNGHAVVDPSEAYSYRMLARSWLSIDPLMGTRFSSLIHTNALPGNNPEYQHGKISWMDWKPITGENAWAFLIGPLQAAYIHYVMGQKSTFVPFQELAVQNALALLPTFAAMQSQIGCVYYAPSGTMGNQGLEPVNPYLVSVENNCSLYAGLKLLRSVLQAELLGERGLRNKEKNAIRASLNIIHTMIHGGQTGSNKPTAGLEAFFRTQAWHNGEFVQGGLANDPNAVKDWVPLLEPRAIDANTWGVAALGSKQIDGWFGFGTCYGIWRQIKSWGAYGVDKQFWGVGYSDQDGNGQTPDGRFKQGVLSAEWTAGAITMVRNMIHYYQTVAGTSVDFTMARQFVQNLVEDEHAMLDAVQKLRFDLYLKSNFPGKPSQYESLLTSKTQPYLYASKRVLIPFGWYANPLPSTCSTAWIIMLANEYDPFGYGGKPN